MESNKMGKLCDKKCKRMNNEVFFSLLYVKKQKKKLSEATLTSDLLTSLMITDDDK